MFSDAVLFELYERHTVDVARLYARKSTQFVLELYSSEKTLNEREGELVLGIREPHSDYYLCRLTFLFAARGGGVALVIGGLQGPCGGHKRDVIAATRLLSGLRPKDAVLLAARSLARELAADNIRVNAIAPGPVATGDAGDQLAAETVRRYTDRMCIKRLGSEADIVGPLLFLAGELSSWITGQVLVVDGGGSMLG